MRSAAIALGVLAAKQVDTGLIPTLAVVLFGTGGLYSLYQANVQKKATASLADKTRQETRRSIEQAVAGSVAEMKQINDLVRAELGTTRAELAAARAEIGRLEAEIQQLKHELLVGHGDRKMLEAKIAELMEQRDQRAREVAELRGRVADLENKSS